ncbi:MAG TPA: hypothetical protein VKV96_04590, partial [Roseiarcus sp.]|nr:hypothetical protein [Roseiarcus sp.]
RFTNMVQERVLKILCFFAGHVPIPFVLGRLLRPCLSLGRSYRLHLRLFIERMAAWLALRPAAANK